MKINFTKIENSNNRMQIFLDLWLLYMHELGDERSDDKILAHAKKIIEIQEQKQKENKIYNIELCEENGNVIGFCLYSIAEIKYQKDTDYGLIIKPLVNNKDYGYLMEFYIKPEYRLKGCGRAMCDHIMEKYKIDNIEKIILTSTIKAELFWEKLEFKNSNFIDPINNLHLYIRNI